MRRWFRTLRAQLFVWAVLPVTFVIIAFAFTGVYAHQHAMQDFVAERDLALARLTAQMIEDGLAHGAVSVDGSGLMARLQPLTREEPGTIIVVDEQGQALAHHDPQQLGTSLVGSPSVAAALDQQEGFVILPEGSEGPVLVAFAPVTGTGWVVLAREPVEELFGPILRLSSLAPAVAVGAGILSLLVLTFGWRTIVRPLQQLAQATGQVYGGDYSAISQPVGGVQEVRDLHQALAEMVERIRGFEAGMRDYLGAVTRGQEVERERLARELHDGPVQGLIALGQRAEMAQRLVERGDTARAQALLGELRGAELETVEELRRLIGALRPIYLEDLGFLPALEMLVQHADERTPARVWLDRETRVPRLPPEVELAAYRIAQEALNNAIQHGQAERVTVRVRWTGGELTLSVADDGVGFTPAQTSDLLTKAGHFGLVGMQERATRLGGTLQVLTAPGEGTRVTARLPGQPLSV
jgi:signal transduction histidine kinase